MTVDRGSKHALKAQWLRYNLMDGEYDALLIDAMQSVARTEAIEAALSWLEGETG